jgi:hypothetical protein
LSHNSRDKTAARALATELRAHGVSVWLDEERLRPGLPWQRLLESGIRASRSVAVLVGADGLGPWEHEEMRSALSFAVKDGRPVIPVVLANAPTVPELPLFLEERTWVDMRVGTALDRPSALDLLIWGITGKHRGQTAQGPTPDASGHQAQGMDGRSERQLLHQCIDTVFASEEELRTFCFEHFPEVYHNLREMDRRPHITRELIGYVIARAKTATLWDLLQALNPRCTGEFGEIDR